jgi:hypothetical protein
MVQQVEMLGGPGDGNTELKSAVNRFRVFRVAGFTRF